MKRHFLTCLLAIAGILAASAVPGLAQPGTEDPPGPPGQLREQPPASPRVRPERLFEEHADRLGLDAETLDKIRAIIATSREEGRALRERVRAERKAMYDLLDAETPDKAAIMAQADVVGAAMTAAHKHRLTKMLEIRALLTPEQREELKKLRKELRPWKHHRRPPYGKSR